MSMTAAQGVAALDRCLDLLTFRLVCMSLSVYVCLFICMSVCVWLYVCFCMIACVCLSVYLFILKSGSELTVPTKIIRFDKQISMEFSQNAFRKILFIYHSSTRSLSLIVPPGSERVAQASSRCTALQANTSIDSIHSVESERVARLSPYDRGQAQRV